MDRGYSAKRQDYARQFSTIQWKYKGLGSYRGLRGEDQIDNLWWGIVVLSIYNHVSEKGSVMVYENSNAVDSWAQLKSLFFKKYRLAGVNVADNMSPLNVRQKIGDTIAKFKKRFKAAIELIDNLDEKHAIGCYISNLNLGTLKTTLTFNPPSTLAALYQDCSKMSQIEESQWDEQDNRSNKGNDKVEDKDTSYKAKNDQGGGNPL